jgi:thiosulfate dehydrogenase [quinone] large subunit
LTDPAVLDPTARDYSGNQITRFAPGTPLEGFLANFAVPNATLFGVMTMGGELCIGVAVLLGLLTRFSAAMGLLLNLTFFLSATWDVRPFYFGADLPYAFGWLTLMLTGPGALAFDIPLRRWLSDIAVSPAATLPAAGSGHLMSRRAFVGMGAGVLASAMLAATGAGWGVLHSNKAEALAVGSTMTPTPGGTGTAAATSSATPLRTQTPRPTEQPTTSPAGETATPSPTEIAAPKPSATPTSEAAAKQMVAAAGTLPQGQALEFTLPTGEPAVLVHNDAGYSAYVALCTHQGCAVKPAASGILRFPCHAAEFDPKAAGEPVRGPARRPLSNIALDVDTAGNLYLAGQL